MEKAKGLLAVVGEEAVYTEDDYFPKRLFCLVGWCFFFVLWFPVKCSTCPSHFDS